MSTEAPLDEVLLCRTHGAVSCACPESNRERFVREGALMEAGLRSLHYEGEQLDATITPHPEVVRVLYAGLVKLLGDAPNYVETKVQTKEGGAFVVLARRQEGRTPHELRKQAEAKATRLGALLRERWSPKCGWASYAECREHESCEAAQEATRHDG